LFDFLYLYLRIYLTCNYIQKNWESGHTRYSIISSVCQRCCCHCPSVLFVSVMFSPLSWRCLTFRNFHHRQNKYFVRNNLIIIYDQFGLNEVSSLFCSFTNRFYAKTLYCSSCHFQFFFHRVLLNLCCDSGHLGFLIYIKRERDVVVTVHLFCLCLSCFHLSILFSGITGENGTKVGRNVT
jgi:hypothetical protein